MWDFFATVRNRHSIRQYQTDMPVEDEKLHAILEMASAAPSAGDLQSYGIMVVRNVELRKKLAVAAQNQLFIHDAPVCLVFYTDPARADKEFGERGKSLYATQDATIAAAYAQLAAVAAGLGSTWVGYFDEEQVCRTLDLEAGYTPIALLSLGYPAEIPEATSRRQLNDIAVFRD